jgi:outer membrane immunogenic protein
MGEKKDRLLLFATGGLAIGEAHSEGSVTVTNFDLSHAINSQLIWSGSHSEVKAGFVVDGGAEWAFADRWTVKAEYLFYDLGNMSHPLACAGGTVPFGPQTFACTSNPGLFPTLGNAVSALHGSIVRVGINYRFN